MANFYGPWATTIHVGPHSQLSTFWKRRFLMLVAVRQSNIGLGWRGVLGLAAVAAITWSVPTLRDGPEIAAAEPEPDTTASAAVQEEGNLRESSAAQAEAPRQPSGDRQTGEDANTVDAFKKLYALSENEILKHVAPPFPDSRMTYYRQEHRSQAELIPKGPDNMFFRWEDGALKYWGMSFASGDGTSLPTVLRIVADIYPQEIVPKDDELLKTSIPGDFIVRVDDPTEKVIARLEEVLRNRIQLPVKIRLGMVEREVFVARGRFDFQPIDENRERIEVYGEKLNENPRVGGGGSGDFEKFLKWVGMWIEQPVVSDVDDPPESRLSWHYNLESPFTDEKRRKAKDPALVLKNLTPQTGLRFTQETRKIRALIVERDE